MDIAFLNTITILYVEDHLETQTKIYKLLKNVFKNVYIASNGQEGLEIFLKYESKIDIIISDINMPNVTGLEMLKVIRDKKHKTPLIYTSAYSDSSYLLEAIGLNVSGYVIKPFEIQDLINKVEQVTKEINSRKTIKKEEKRLKNYTELIDKVAIISKTDKEGNITFVNELFCETSGYSKDELIGKSHAITRHPEMASSIFSEMWESLKDGRVWTGKIKNISKNGDTYIFNSTIFPNFDDHGEITEYVAIRFLITDEENEKRQFKKNILNSIKESKLKEKKYVDNLIKYEKSINELKTYVKLKTKSSAAEREKILKQHGQILYYEKEISKIKEEFYNSKKFNNDKIFKLYYKLKELKDDNEKVKIANKKLIDEIDLKKEQVEKLHEQVIEQSKVIVNLRDVIQHRESQLALAKLKY